MLENQRGQANITAPPATHVNGLRRLRAHYVFGILHQCLYGRDSRLASPRVPCFPLSPFCPRVRLVSTSVGARDAAATSAAPNLGVAPARGVVGGKGDAT